MLKKLSVAAGVLTLMLGLGGCGEDETDASNEVLQQVIDGFLKEKSVCMPLSLTEPDGELSPGVQGMLGEPIVKVALPQGVAKEQVAAFKQMQALVAAGIYAPFVEDVVFRSSGERGVVAAQVYQLTDKGRSYVYDSRFGDLFCMGHEQVKRILMREDAIEKTPKGRYLVHISYEPEFIMVPWAEALAAAGNQQLAQQIAPGQVSRTTLVYADKVWQDSRQFYKLNK
ncbi:hypothetical protein AB8Q18_07885 [Neisseriaceae bacterium CLB008]|nr:hypothetical protein [Neisseriaceae bacterium]